LIEKLRYAILIGLLRHDLRAKIAANLALTSDHVSPLFLELTVRGLKLLHLVVSESQSPLHHLTGAFSQPLLEHFAARIGP
jgi:hypothetical protein